MVTASQSAPKSFMPQGDVRKSILVVEDESEIRQLVVLHLRREGFDVSEVGDGEEARGLLSSNNYDLVVLDWMLPSLSGLEITRWMRKRAQMAQTPILFVTAKAEPEHVATMFALPEGGAVFEFRLEDSRVGQLAIPAPATPGHADELWKHTCFEVFLGAPGLVKIHSAGSTSPRASMSFSLNSISASCADQNMVMPSPMAVA